MSFNTGGRPPDCGAPKASGSRRHMLSMRSVQLMAAEASQPTITNPTMFVPGAGGQHLHHGYLNNVQFDSGDCRGSAAPSGYGSLYSKGGGQAAAGGIHYSYNEYEQLGRSDLHLYPLGDRSVEMQQHHHPAAPASLYEQNSVHAPSMCLLPAPSPHDHHVHAQLHSRPGQQLSLHEQTEELEAGSSVALALQLQAAGTGANHHVRVEQTTTNYNIMQAGRSTGGAVIKESSSNDTHAGARTANAVEVMQEADGDEEVEEEGEELIGGEEESMQGRQLVQAMENVNGKLQVAEAAAAMGSCSSLYGEQHGPGGAGMSMKKRRLTNEQVRSLEVSFGRESKLEPERKNELAQELGLQPRQVAVWFQNRRARSKTKQLERDFDLLKLQFDAVRSEKEKLQAQVARLKALLDAQMAARKGNTPTTSSEKEAMDEDTITQSLTQQNKTVIESIKIIGDKKQIREASEKQEGTPSIVPQCMKVFKGDNTQPAHMQAFEADKGTIKVPITLEVKPSLQVPHIDHHHHMYPQQQDYFSHTLSPPTKLSLSTPQKLLHDMVSMKMEEGNPQPSHHERPFIHTQHHHLNAHDDEGYRNDSIICFHPAWHHDS